MTTLTNTLDTKIQTKDNLRLLMQVLGGSLFIALCSQIKIPLPFTPVPLTLQTLSVMIVGGMLGSRLGALSVLLYLAESMFGLPVLAGGRADMLALFSPVGGYLVGFCFLAYIVGFFAERIDTMGKSMLLVGITIGCISELVIGALWLSHYVGLSNAIFMGGIPFIPGEIIKTVAAYAIISRAR